MKSEDLTRLLLQVAQGEVSVEAAVRSLSPSADLGFAKVDLHRPRRTGFPEVIYGEGKTQEQLKTLFLKLRESQTVALATRVSREKAEAVLTACPEAEYLETAGILRWIPKDVGYRPGYIAVVCAGTSDLPVAEEAAATAETLGSRVERIYDVGVSGLHRLIDQMDVIRQAQTVIVVAGMEGALASVVGGLVDSPVIAVPTSVGYGAHLGGLSTLLSMLNSCAAGVAVVNIDNGFGAGHFAARIHQTQHWATLEEEAAK
ncbi:1-(5-phosphoribosyl)-5-amino-4-imidazole-carboxylate carboxylase [Marinithermofilum abyssi]|uniref:1-(5-phosphoribosyl)-5-amino-4-imidazole-carboxylate carboxylase n=1 Tax=Marinithermofilum abyssi TaxID=1571185 RepID=A0A8J2VEB8_9BACL|nr:nickel pincer cofactor biosynthesis protein LarB [Marinithermofilum abyssi]GGE24497.1 1-(5-phosphoribosyl)-5-amino-4-imidazole-carboxylate carboxylase [Marinithermofilum abyssi]